MLVQFTVENYRSIKTSVVISFVASKDKSFEEYLLHPDFLPCMPQIRIVLQWNNCHHRYNPPASTPLPRQEYLFSPATEVPAESYPESTASPLLFLLSITSFRWSCGVKMPFRHEVPIMVFGNFQFMEICRIGTEAW